MKIRTTALCVATLGFSSFTAFAAPGDIIGDGNIVFTGSVVADTCFVESPTGDAKTINVAMGSIHTTNITNSSVADPVRPEGLNLGGAEFNVTCSTATGVEMKFAAPAASLITGNKILKINGGSTGQGLANGVGIAIYPDRTSKTAYDLSSGKFFNDTLTAGQKIRVQFSAAYVKTTGSIVAGTANATLPFTIVSP